MNFNGSYISGKIDAVADILERKGLLREASELDSISNAIDKIAYIAKGRPPYSKFFPPSKREGERTP